MSNARKQYGLGVLALVFAAQAQAAEVSATGTATYVSSPDVTELKDGNRLVRAQLKGVGLADDPKSSLHQSLQSCGGTTLVNKKGETLAGAGYCDGVDRDGDLFWLSWRANATGSDWTFTGGTGKYAGVTGGGKTVNAVQAPDRLVITWEGRWTTR